MNKNARLLAALILSGWAFVAQAATDWSAQDYDLYPGDFDGDGKTDLLYVAKDPAKASGIAKSDGSGPNLPFQSWPGNYLGIPWSGNQYAVHVADFNGDSRADIFLQRNTPGDSFLLTADVNGKITSTHQTVPHSHLGLYWSADQHKIAVGDFSGDGKADLFLQATSATGTNAIVLADSNGQFTTGPQQSWTDSSWSAFKWSTKNSNIFIGDFNGDGESDLLIQAKPNIVMIDYDVPIPVPTYQPNSFGVVLSQGGSTPMQQTGVQQWNRNAHGVDWSPSATNIIVGNFDGNPGSDVLLQGRNSGRPSYLLSGHTTGAVFSSAASVSANVPITADGARLIAANFDGGSAVGIYIQATTPSGTNHVANSVGSSISATAHNPAASTGVVPATAVGYTPGSFAVSNLGAATYSIPIEVPPGVAGIQPDLAIGYQSDSGNGLLGVGWSLSGLSSIERCPKTIAQDNFISSVALTLTDSFCLDGNKLRLTNGPTYAYGQAGSTYRTEIDTFSRTTAYGQAGNGPEYFIVEDKNGLKYWYGNSNDSRIEVVNAPTNSTTPHTWALSKVTDRSGNSMSITYAEDGAPYGSYRPIVMTYTSNVEQNLPAAYRVEFAWDIRPSSDVLRMHVAGGAVTERHRLSRIETRYHDPSIGNWRLVRKYQLSYNASGIVAHSRLASIQECDGQGSCLSPTMISWQEGTAGWSTIEAEYASPPSTHLMQFSHVIDLDGDGREDLVYPRRISLDLQGTSQWCFRRSQGNGDLGAAVCTDITAGTLSNPLYAYALPIDYASDGRRGLLINIPGNAHAQVLRWNGSTIALTQTNLQLTLSDRHLVADFDGDAREDIFYGNVSGNQLQFLVHKNHGAGFTAAQIFHAEPFDSDMSIGSFTGQDGPGPTYVSERIADFNGDGRADLLLPIYQEVCFPHETGAYCYEEWIWKSYVSTGIAFIPATLSLNCNSLEGFEECPLFPLLTDLNGDGNSDVLFATNSSQPWVAYYGSGIGLDANSVETDLVATGYGMAFAMDYDGDGREDIVYPSEATSTWWAASSNGAGFGTPIDTRIPYDIHNGSLRVLDVNGDGLRDMGYLSSQYRIHTRNGVVADLVKSITDGFGNRAAVVYAPLSDSSVYTKGTGAGYPQIDLQGAMYVVKQYSLSDGIGGSFSVTEKYAGARMDLRGRGLLGFASRESIDGRTGIKSAWTFRQDFPYIGFISSSSTYQPNDGPQIAGVVNTLAELPIQGNPYDDRRFPYIAASVQVSYEVGGLSNGQPIARVTTTTALDDYGNPTSISTTKEDLTSSAPLAYTSVTANSYSVGYDTVNWCLDFVTQQTVTNTIPVGAPQMRKVQYIKDTANPEKCRAHQQIVEPDDDSIKVTTTFGYDDFGNLNSETVTASNVSARTTTTNYGSQGVFPVSVTDALNQTGYKTYDYALGVPLTSTDPNTLQVIWEYDGFGRPTREIRPDNTKTAWMYLSCGVGNNYCGDDRLRYQVLKQELGSNNQVIRSTIQMFDAMSRSLYDQAQTLSGAFSTVATNYDNQGRVIQRSQPYFAGFPAYVTTLTYDLLGRPIKEERRISESDSGLQSVQFGYNRLTHTQTDPNGKLTTKTYNAIGQVTQMTDAANGITQYAYDQFGNLKKTIDPANNEIVNTFNIRGMKLSTNDPDMGNWTYTYYPTGELWTQTDAKAKTVTFTYDPLSRPKTRDEFEGRTEFTYGDSSGARNIGKLQSVSSPGGYSETYTYDSLGRIQDVTTNADATSFVVSNTYSSTTGFLDAVTYPTSTSAVAGSRFKVQYEYENGLLKRARDFNAPSTVYWEQVSTNASGQTLDEQLGNGLHTYSSYDAITSSLGSRTTGASSQVQNLTYQWDKVGNLTQRKDNNLNLTEDFIYDDLYRLTTSTLNNVTNLSLTYAANGNITSKSDVGTYTYPTQGINSVRPHAVTGAGPNSYGYDLNGNMTTRNGNTITWYSYNLPNRIDKGSNYSQFFYGADRGRYKQIAHTASGGSLPPGTETTIYIGGLFEKVTKPSGVIEYKHYVMAGREAMAIRTLRSNDANDTRYLHKDHLGNVDAITNESGAVIQRLSYDAFGKRREAIAWSGPLTSGDWTSIAAITHRGFTFHEHLDNVDLIHMNGRVYDPDMGRFISADPFIQAPLMSQSLNRYSYVMNNPLSLIDPSGFSWLSKKWKKLTRWARRQWDSFRRDLNNIVGFALMLIPIPGLQQLGAAIFLSPVRVHRGRDGYYVSVGYAGFGVDNRPDTRISTRGGGNPPPMTPPAGAMSLNSNVITIDEPDERLGRLTGHIRVSAVPNHGILITITGTLTFDNTVTMDQVLAYVKAIHEAWNTSEKYKGVRYAVRTSLEIKGRVGIFNPRGTFHLTDCGSRCGPSAAYGSSIPLRGLLMRSGIELSGTEAHEFGHVLGIDHRRPENLSIMNSHWDVPDRRVSGYDLYRLEQLYGR